MLNNNINRIPFLIISFKEIKIMKIKNNKDSYIIF